MRTDTDTDNGESPATNTSRSSTPYGRQSEIGSSRWKLVSLDSVSSTAGPVIDHGCGAGTICAGLFTEYNSRAHGASKRINSGAIESRQRSTAIAGTTGHNDATNS